MVSYCGRPCQREAWLAYHKYECGLYKKSNEFYRSLMNGLVSLAPGQKPENFKAKKENTNICLTLQMSILFG